MVDLDVRYRGVPALVLGASGFIGAMVARALVARGAVVYAAGRDPERLISTLGRPGLCAHVIGADLSEPGAVARVVKSAAPSIVFNLAGYGVDPTERDADTMLAINTTLVRELTAALSEQPGSDWPGVALVLVGSALEYGPVRGRLHERVAPMPTTPYGRSKLEGTHLASRWAADAGRRAVVARLFNVYGPGEHHGRLFPSLRALARTGGRLRLTAGLQSRDFTYVEDVVEGLLRLGVSEVEPGEVVNLASGRLTSVRTFAETLAAELGIEPTALEFGALPDREEEMWHGEVDVTRLRALTNWTPRTSLVEGVRRSEEFENEL
jgi:nucleoside-diphosphate-sugar epimerase